MHLTTNSILDQTPLLRTSLILVFLLATGCWSEVQFENPESPNKEQPASEEPTTPPAATEQAPAANSEVLASTPTPAEEEPRPTEPVASPPATSLAFEDFLAEGDTASEENSEKDQPPAAEEPTLPPASPSVGDRYVPSTSLELTENPDSDPAATLPAGDRYATPSIDEDTTSPVEESPTSNQASPREPLPWDLPMEPPIDASSEEPSEPSEPSESPFLPMETQPPVDTEPMIAPVVEKSAETEPYSNNETPSIVASLPEGAPKQIDPKNTRNLAWMLGSKWSLWRLSEHAGAPKEEQERYFQESEVVAKALGIELTKTPPFSASRPTAAFMENLLYSGRELGTAIGKAHGAEEMALFEASMKSNLPLKLADSRPELIPAVIRAVTDAAKRADLPVNLLQPFTTALTDEPTPEQVDQAVFDFHQAVEESLQTSGNAP